MIRKTIKILLILYRKILADSQRILIKKIFKYFYYRFRYIKLKIYLTLSKNNVNLILGAALTKQKGWFSTNEEWFNIVRNNHWERLFNSKKRVKRVLAEHVLEHLTLDEMRKALYLIYKNMVYGGTLRIAVPDGNNPNQEYRNHCGINGIGADASDHKQFLTFELLSNEIEKIGFQFTLKEGYTQNNKLISEKLNFELGTIMRSRSNQINIDSKEGWSFYDSNTSLIIDCFKKR